MSSLHRAGPPVRRGVVQDFDPAVGLGTLRSGGETFGFHCTQIAGGGRTIEVGSDVHFVVVAARLGRWEAAEVTLRPG